MLSCWRFNASFCDLRELWSILTDDLMRVTHFRQFKASYHPRVGLSHLSIQYVNQSESLFPICCETNGISKESTYADNMKL